MFPKDVPEGFRFTVYLPPSNAQTEKHGEPNPHADPMLAKMAGASILDSLAETAVIPRILGPRRQRSCLLYYFRLGGRNLSPCLTDTYRFLVMK